MGATTGTTFCWGDVVEVETDTTRVRIFPVALTAHPEAKDTPLSRTATTITAAMANSSSNGQQQQQSLSTPHKGSSHGQSNPLTPQK